MKFLVLVLVALVQVNAQRANSETENLALSRAREFLGNRFGSQSLDFKNGQFPAQMNVAAIFDKLANKDNLENLGSRMNQLFQSSRGVSDVLSSAGKFESRRDDIKDNLENLGSKLGSQKRQQFLSNPQFLSAMKGRRPQGRPQTQQGFNAAVMPDDGSNVQLGRPQTLESFSTAVMPDDGSNVQLGLSDEPETRAF